MQGQGLWTVFYAWTLFCTLGNNRYFLNTEVLYFRVALRGLQENFQKLREKSSHLNRILAHILQKFIQNNKTMFCQNNKNLSLKMGEGQKGTARTWCCRAFNYSRLHSETGDLIGYFWQMSHHSTHQI